MCTHLHLTPARLRFSILSPDDPSVPHPTVPLVKFLVSNLDGSSLATLVLQEAKEGDGEDAEDNNVA